MKRARYLSLLAAIWLVNQADAAEFLSSGRFQNMLVFQPAGETQRVIYLLADPGPQDAMLEQLGRSLAGRGSLVVRIDTAALRAGLQDASAACVDLGADFEGLSHFLQAHYRLSAYHPPYFAGFGAGAAFAYALMAQAPTSTYAGVLSYDFCPDLKVRTALCGGDDLRTARHVASGSTELLPITRSHTRWVVQPDGQGRQCDIRSTRAFLTRLPQSDLITVRSETRQAATRSSMDTIMESLGQLQAQRQDQGSGMPTELTDLPLVEVVPPAVTADAFAVLLSGDGGWTGLDKDVAAALAARGIAVVGWDSLRYFWQARTPEGLAADAERLIAHYMRTWQKSRVLLLGYSQGANVMPFLVNRLSADTRRRIVLVAMTGLEATADFEFHFANWVEASARGLAVLPETARLTGIPVLCIYGRGDDESLCPQLDPKHVRSIALPGGHHFNGDYGALARVILEAADLH